jgi:DoxX-like family
VNDKAMRWTGFALTGVFVLFMLFDATIKLIRLPIVEQTMAQLGYPPGLGFPIGVAEGIFLILYLAPCTSMLGAVMFTAMFGGAMASHMRLNAPLFSHVLFGAYLGMFMWGGLWLRNPALRATLPLKRSDATELAVPSPHGRWLYRGCTLFFVGFLIADTFVKLVHWPVVERIMTHLGYGPEAGVRISIMETIFLILYLVPRTSVLGAVLFMGMLGGVVAGHVRVGDPLITHELAGVYLGIAMWARLWLRDPALRAVFPIRNMAG